MPGALKFDALLEDLFIGQNNSFVAIDSVNGMLKVHANNCCISVRLNQAAVLVKGNNNTIVMYRNAGIVHLEGSYNSLTIADTDFIGVVKVQQQAQTNTLNGSILNSHVMLALPSIGTSQISEAALRRPSLFDSRYSLIENMDESYDESENLIADQISVRAEPESNQNTGLGGIFRGMFREAHNFYRETVEELGQAARRYEQEEINPPPQQHSPQQQLPIPQQVHPQMQESEVDDGPHMIALVNVEPVARPIPDTCAICHDTIGRGTPGTAYLDCLDWYHEDCITEWLKRGRISCPSCRHKTTALYRVIEVNQDLY